MKKAFVTGAAGFIGSHLVEHLLSRGASVVGWDNLSTGQEEFINQATASPAFSFVRGDNLDFKRLRKAMAECDITFHMAANADVRFGLDHPRRDLEQNTIATFNVLEAMRANDVKTIIFASTGSVYGEADVVPTPENAPFPVQTSLYGASKLAGEGLVQAYCEGFGFTGYVFRFVSILGERYTHGHVFDFYRQLRSNPSRLRVLGDGTQRKSYLYVQDCVNAILHVLKMENTRTAQNGCEIYNLGTTEYCQVIDSIKWITEHLGLQPRVEFSGGARGWIGDNPFIFLDTDRIRKTGWRAQLSIEQSIIKTLEWLQENSWILEKR